MYILGGICRTYNIYSLTVRAARSQQGVPKLNLLKACEPCVAGYLPTSWYIQFLYKRVVEVVR